MASIMGILMPECACTGQLPAGFFRNTWVKLKAVPEEIASPDASLLAQWVCEVNCSFSGLGPGAFLFDSVTTDLESDLLAVKLDSLLIMRFWP